MPKNIDELKQELVAAKNEAHKARSKATEAYARIDVLHRVIAQLIGVVYPNIASDLTCSCGRCNGCSARAALQMLEKTLSPEDLATVKLLEESAEDRESEIEKLFSRRETPKE